jgi:AcrR family transcriptional regulator
MIETRIFDAALALYGAQGWLGFSLDAVARGAMVSKDAMYRRWKTRETLLHDALHQRWDWVGTIDEGDVRRDLLELGARTFDTFAGPYGEVALQLRGDARRFAEVRAFAEPYREVMVHQGRGIIRKAIQRGDLPEAVNPGMIMDLLIGSIINHIISTPRRLRDAMMEGGPRFVRTIVDVVLAGVDQMIIEQRHD